MNSRDKERISFLQMGSMELRSTIQIQSISVSVFISPLSLPLSMGSRDTEVVESRAPSWVESEEKVNIASDQLLLRKEGWGIL